MPRGAQTTETSPVLNYAVLAGNKKQSIERKFFATIESMIGDSGKINISPSSLFSDKQKVLDITTNNGELYSFVCEYKLSQMIHNKIVSLTDLSVMEVCQVPLLSEGPDKGKLVWKILLPEGWSQSITVEAKEMKQASEVKVTSLFTADQLASW